MAHVTVYPLRGGPEEFHGARVSINNNKLYVWSMGKTPKNGGNARILKSYDMKDLNSQKTTGRKMYTSRKE